MISLRRMRSLLLGVVVAWVGLWSREGRANALERQRLAVVPLGVVDPELVKSVAEEISRRFDFEVLTLQALPLPETAWYAPRKRWRAEKLLKYLSQEGRIDADRVAAVTEEPISTTKGSIVDWGIAGLGTLAGKSSVFTAHLFRGLKKKDPARYRRYMANLVLHEVGHTLGLPHCERDDCVMADAKGNALRAAERSTNEFCPHCAALLGARLRPRTG